MKYIFYLFLIFLIGIKPILGHEISPETRRRTNSICKKAEIPKGSYSNGLTTVYLQELLSGELVFNMVFENIQKSVVITQEVYCSLDSFTSRPGFVFFDVAGSYHFYFQVDDLSTVRVIGIFNNEIYTNDLYYLVED